MKTKFLTAIAFLALLFSACDDTTDTIGDSLTDGMDRLDISTGVFPVQTASYKSGAVLSRNSVGYLGKIRDDETGAYVTGDFMAQFSTLENYYLPDIDSIASVEVNASGEKEVIADSCTILLYYDKYFGDSLATMKLSAYEMSRPMEEGINYYSDFDPMAGGYIRDEKDNGIKTGKVYTLSDLTVDEGIKENSNYVPSIKINLNKPYTDKDGKTYNNYGTYIMRRIYANKDDFKNPYNFIHKVCPGFYFKLDDGLGSMAYIDISSLNVYFSLKTTYKNNNDEVRDTVVVGVSTFAGTEEVLQTTNITNDNEAIDRLVADESCNYLKTPAGIFTEMTLPVDDILKGHENDTINVAKVVLTRYNNKSNGDKYNLGHPSSLLMIPLDSLDTFFEKGKVTDNKTSFVASASSSDNYYTYNNISGMITYMADVKKKGMAENSLWIEEHPNWNKVILVPVTVTKNTSTLQVVRIVHDMSLTSARLVRGQGNGDDNPVSISVIYSKFSDKR